MSLVMELRAAKWGYHGITDSMPFEVGQLQLPRYAARKSNLGTLMSIGRSSNCTKEARDVMPSLGLCGNSIVLDINIK